MSRPVIEVIVASVEDAEAAVEGGASRLEVVRSLGEDGLTPELDLVAKIKACVALPLRVMVRPRNTFFGFSRAEITRMRITVRELEWIGVDGIVLGFLTPERDLDFEILDTVMAESGRIGVTFHRAFDHSRDMVGGVAQLAGHRRVDRLLTSAGAPAALDGVEALSRLQRIAGDRLTLIAAGGITSANAARILTRTGLREIHVGRSVRTPATSDGRVDARKVREIAAALSSGGLVEQTLFEGSSGPR